MGRYDQPMAPAFELADFEITLAMNESAPPDLQEIGRAYWDVEGVDNEKGKIVWAHKANALPFKAWSGTAHYAAAAALEATADGYQCSECANELTLSSRQTMADAWAGERALCRACERTVDAHAEKLLSPDALLRRTHLQQASLARTEQLARARDLGTERQQSIESAYPAETEDDGGYTVINAGFTDRVAALAVIHAAGEPSGLIKNLDYSDASIAPSPETSQEVLVSAWRAELLIVHPSSPHEAFLWLEEQSAELGNGIYTEQIHFAVPGQGPLRYRLAKHSDDLRESLALARLWSTEQAELRTLAEKCVQEEAIRYFEHQLESHGLPSPALSHPERLQSHAHVAARSFALGHIYRFAWTAARDAISAYQRIPAMSREKAATHGLNKFASYIERALEDNGAVGEAFNETSTFPLSAITEIVFRIIMKVAPMTTSPVRIAELTARSPDEELRQACDAQIPEHTVLMEWLRTSMDWDPSTFSGALVRSGEPQPTCAPKCAHERISGVATGAVAVFDRIVSRIGDRDAAIVSAEALALGNETPFRGRTGDLVLELVAREMGWAPEHLEQS